MWNRLHKYIVLFSHTLPIFVALGARLDNEVVIIWSASKDKIKKVVGRHEGRLYHPINARGPNTEEKETA